ncbi:MAG: hypothetical protein Q8K75_02975 [Chlamydiales bacterium]|nr:hypothetical protein [Chlamydiales bacterium]
MLGIRRLFILLLTAAPALLSAVDLTPWFGRDKLIEVRPWASYQWYPKIDTDQGKVNKQGRNVFFGTSASIASDNKYSLSGESLFSRTNQHSFTLENMRITVRRQWLNDIVGDPFTLVTGATVTVPTTRALRDYNTIYHGKVEFEGHAAVGREASCGAFWNSRWWAAVALGKADIGCPWLRGRATFEKNFWNQHQWKIFAEGTGGMGQRRLSLISPFPGYGKVKYRTIDAGAGYSFLIDGYGRSLTAEYSVRVWGENAPIQAQNVTFCLLIPFCL